MQRLRRRKRRRVLKNVFVVVYDTKCLTHLISRDLWLTKEFPLEYVTSFADRRDSYFSWAADCWSLVLPCCFFSLPSGHSFHGCTLRTSCRNTRKNLRTTLAQRWDWWWLMAMNDDKGASSKSADYSGVLGISVKRQRHFIHLTEMGDWLWVIYLSARIELHCRRNSGADIPITRNGMISILAPSCSYSWSSRHFITGFQLLLLPGWWWEATQRTEAGPPRNHQFQSAYRAIFLRLKIARNIKCKSWARSTIS